MVGDNGIVSGWSGGGLFNSMSGLIDHTELYSVFITDPDFYALLMEYVKKKVFEYSDAVIEAGVDAICMAGNVAGGFVGKKMFDKYIMPYEKEYVDYVQSKGVPIIYHNCGLIMNLVESYKELGVKNVEPFSPPPMGDTDLNKLKEILYDEYSVTCGVDQVNVIQNGSLEDVEAATIDLMKKGKMFKNFIFQNADFLEYNTPVQNVERLVKVALANAEY